MKYTVELIYKYTGQFDRIVSVGFIPGTASFEEYGEYLVGKFYYSLKERQKLQQLIKTEGILPETTGKIKFEASPFPEIPKEKIERLKDEGFDSADILEILQFSQPVENEFSKKDLRHLPDPLEIKMDLSDFDEEEMFLWLNSSRIDRDMKLMPSEINRHNGILLRKYEGKLSEEDLSHFKDPETGDIKAEINYEFLKSKFLKGSITKAEEEQFFSQTKIKMEERMNFLLKELERSQERWKEVGINYKDQLARLMHLVNIFEPKRICAGKYPIWLDFERFIHIYIRHVSETQVGDRFKNAKSVFQYSFDDIYRLIEIVIKKVEDEIIDHFDNNPETEFRRIGDMSIYYNGDYYAVQIDPDWRLMRFHKKS